MWSFAVYHFRISDEQFWRLTLREFVYLLKRHNEAQELQDRRAGRICALLANIYRGKQGKTFTEEDFIPKPLPPPQTPEQQVEILKTLGTLAQARYGHS